MKIRHKLDFFFPPEENEIARKNKAGKRKKIRFPAYIIYI